MNLVNDIYQIFFFSSLYSSLSLSGATFYLSCWESSLSFEGSMMTPIRFRGFFPCLLFESPGLSIGHKAIINYRTKFEVFGILQ